MTNLWGIIGLGGIAKTFAKAVNQSKTSTILAVGSRDEKKARALAPEFDATRPYGSYEDLLADEDVTFVYNALPNSMHAEWTIKCAEAGKHILCEKPLSVTVEEADAMFDAAQANGVVLMEAFMYRCHPQMERAKQIVESGEIGDLRVIRSRFSYGLSDLTNVRYSAPLHGGALMDVGCYCVNFSRHIAGARPLEAYGAAVFGPVSKVDESFLGTLTFADGVLAQFDAGMNFAGASCADIMGSKGSISIPVPWKPGDVAEFTVKVGGKERTETVPGANPYMLEAQNLEAVVNEGAPVAMTREETTDNMATICALLTSAREKRMVEP